MSDLAEEITSYLKGEGAPQKRSDLALWYSTDCQRLSGWTKATYADADAAIDEAIQRGLLREIDGKLWLPVPKVERKPEQLELFDE